jgi:NADH-quinone oxidoreductase subunit L
VGAFAKSAQIPLHTWLPDAMEGPTPVSALIHAATMVTAGVYLIARMHPLFELAPTAADVAAILGTLTLVVAASIALVVTDLKRVIAYSTMSQIGYMILGVSAFAYGAGMFHLMTHAFFKALLFMGAGSVIAAMGGVQSLDRMGGFRRAMPFTFVTFTIGALALAGFPLTAGFFSKDEIIAFTLNRGGLYTVLGVIAYAAALVTAFYAFRMVFRVFFGEPVEEARELERGHLAHHDPANPMTGEPEDTDVGFPGPEHHIAEREFPMKLAMGALAVLATVGGVLQIPHVNEGLHQFLEPSFHDSALYEELEPSSSSVIVGMVVGALIGAAGIFVAYTLWVRSPERPKALQARLAPLHTFFVNKWYFDEAIDFLVVRPSAWFGRFANTTFERVFVQGALVGGSTGLVRLASAAVRGIQTGYLRYYAALLLMGVTGLGAYFLISA